MKTASRIVGTAAFRQGYYAQDSPVYGAERRGAPMMAFTRFDTRPILERGIVSCPDLIVIADASLLDDPLVKPLQGLPANGFVLINAGAPAGPSNSVSHDFTAMALDHTGSTAALSVALGAGAAKLARLGSEFIERAVQDELQNLKLDAFRVHRNLDLARACLDRVEALPPAGASEPNVPVAVEVIMPRYEGAWAGTASVVSAPNTPLRKTGDWRVKRPVVDFDRCTHCWICFVNCPDGAITLGPDDAPHIDYGVCKGCLICAEECPIDAIETPREVQNR